MKCYMCLSTHFLIHGATSQIVSDIFIVEKFNCNLFLLFLTFYNKTTYTVFCVLKTH